MTQQVIVNSPTNSGLGDQLFAAFNKVNANFTELYGRSFPPFTPLVSILAADVQVISSTSLTNAGPLVALVPGVHLVTTSVWMFTNGATNGGWKYGFNYTGTFVNSLSFVGGMVTTAGAYNGSFINLLNGNLTSLSNANPDFAHYFGIVNVATSGNLTMQFAQNTSNPTASILRAGSGILSQRLV